MKTREEIEQVISRLEQLIKLVNDAQDENIVNLPVAYCLTCDTVITSKADIERHKDVGHVVLYIDVFDDELELARQILCWVLDREVE